MNNLPENSINENTDGQKEQVPWWQRQVWGQDSLIEDLFSKSKKQEIPENILILHNRELMDLKVFAKTAASIANDKFSHPEFLLYVKIKYYLAKGIGEYQGLNDSVQLFQAAIQAKNSYFILDQTELRYRSSKQQEFYQYVLEILESEADKVKFREKVQAKLTEILPEIKTEEGKTILQSYAEELDRLAEYEFGLKLLTLFKIHKLGDYSILRTISDLVGSLQDKNVNDLKSLTSFVSNNYNVFEKLGNMIGINGQKQRPDIYALMIQYTILNYRHGLSYFNFEELVQVMRKWSHHYQEIIKIREEYTPQEYKLPPQFSEKLPGLDIYTKYKQSLTDPETGCSFMSF